MSRFPWAYFVASYWLTVLVELPVLWFGLSSQHTRQERLFAAVWLTACTLPIVWLVLPNLVVGPRWQYLLAAESFAPIAECLLFRWAISRRASTWTRPNSDDGVIVLANLTSFAVGELRPYL